MAALTASCPRCGKGRLFKGFLSVDSACGVCGLDFKRFDSGDGPAVFIILIAGFIVAGGALLVEMNYQPPYWVHALLWIPLSILLPLAMLRPLKAAMIALEYTHDAREGRREE